MNSHDDNELTADPSELVHFVGSALDHDFKVVLKRRMEAVQIDLRNPGLTLEQLRYFQGELAGLEFWLKLPDEVLKEQNRIEEEVQKKQSKGEKS
jgi:hypothetical protein